MKFYKSKCEIKKDAEGMPEVLNIFKERMEYVREICKEERKSLILDIMWDEVIRTYSQHFSDIQIVNQDDAKMLKNEIILTLYGAAIHHTINGIGLKKWHGSVNHIGGKSKEDECKYKNFGSFSKNIWRPWLRSEVLSDTIYWNEFKEYMDTTIKFTRRQVYRGEDSISYEISQPYPQLIYDILINWESCPINSRYYYGMELESLNRFRDNILSCRRYTVANTDFNSARLFLEYYMIEEWFDFAFMQKFLDIINGKFSVNSNREELYVWNAQIMEYMKRIQNGPSQFIRNRILSKYEKVGYDGFKIPNKNETNKLYGFTIPLLDIVYSYFIYFILDDKFEKDNEDSVNDSVLQACEEYISLQKKEYDIYFSHYTQPINDYNLSIRGNKKGNVSGGCIALEVNVTKSIYGTVDIVPNIQNAETIDEYFEKLSVFSWQGMDNQGFYNPNYYLFFPFNSVYSEYCYQKEIQEYSMVYISYVRRKVKNFLHVEWKGYWYSVPYEYKEKMVVLRTADEEIVIFNMHGSKIAEHTIRHAGADQFITINAHIPDGYNYKELFYKYKLDRFLDRAKKIGDNTANLLNEIIISKRDIRERVGLCNKILMLASEFKDNEKFEAACKKAYELKVCTAEGIKSFYVNKGGK